MKVVWRFVRYVYDMEKEKKEGTADSSGVEARGTAAAGWSASRMPGADAGCTV